MVVGKTRTQGMWTSLENRIRKKMNNVENNIAVVRSVDLRGEICPMTFYKAKMVLTQIKEGSVIEIILKEGEQMKNVPRNIKEDGHKIISICQKEDGFHIQVKKGSR